MSAGWLHVDCQLSLTVYVCILKWRHGKIWQNVEILINILVNQIDVLATITDD